LGYLDEEKLKEIYSDIIEIRKMRQRGGDDLFTLHLILQLVTLFS